MGIYQSPEYCYLTDLKTTNINSDRSAIEYFIEINGDQKRFSFSGLYIEDTKAYIKKNKTVLMGLILNNKWDIPYETLIKTEILDSFIKGKSYPKTPEEKYNNLFLHIFNNQTFDGEMLAFPRNSFFKYYFQNDVEFQFYLDALNSEGLIEKELDNDNLYASLTFDGLNPGVELSLYGKESNRCFVAMTFSVETKEIRYIIKKVCEEMGYNPILIDEVHLESDQTINDGIIAEIRKSKFMIADFTKQRNGVYFEAGFALGLGRKVIYTCRQDDFDNSHFDTNHFSHIVYNNSKELEDQLKDKIEAWIL